MTGCMAAWLRHADSAQIRYGSAQYVQQCNEPTVMHEILYEILLQDEFHANSPNSFDYLYTSHPAIIEK